MKRHFNFIIVEDVPLQRENLLGMLSGRMDLHHLASFETAEDAYGFLGDPANQPIDLLFLDIELPERNGLDFLNSIKNFTHKPRIIITTAYPQYAIPSFDYTSMVTHYILKPIETDKLNKAVDKAIAELRAGEAPEPAPPHYPVAERPFAYFPVADRELKVFFDELLYCEGANVNVKIVTIREAFLTRGPLKNIEKQLPPDTFSRVHDSFIVNLHLVRGHTKRFDALDLRHDDDNETHTIRIGKKYRNEFRNRMNG